jgi:AmmeMemoRadiSam system protein A
MDEAEVTGGTEPAGGSPDADRPTVQTPQDRLASVGPDDAGDVLLPAARAAIAQTLGVATSRPGTPPAWALEPGASFVSLTKNGKLRGCTGSLVARRPLLEDVQANAVNTAMHDLRFTPMTPDELSVVVIEVSVLSAPRPLPVSSLAEAYAALRPGVDGVIVETGAWHRATFLPKMWQEMPDPAVFLEHLWFKAGIAPGVWHEGTTLRTYTTRVWHEVPAAS